MNVFEADLERERERERERKRGRNLSKIFDRERDIDEDDLRSTE